MSYANSCYVNGSYPLLLFLLIKEGNLNDTFFFLGRGVPENIARNLKNSWHLNIYFKKKNKFTKYIEMYLLYRNLEKFLIEKELINKKMYMQDNVSYSQFFMNHMESCFLLEDGLANYNKHLYDKIQNNQIKDKKLKILRDRFLKRSRYNYKIFGLSEKIKKIYLTGIAEIPEIIKNKVEIVNLKEKWEQLSFEEQEEILRIFDLKNSDLIKWQKLKNKVLLITQPLSEDGIINEKEKIEIYRKIVEKNKSENIMIKPHPREKTNYKNIFPNIELMEGKFPLEILMLLGINFKEVITIFSTAALNFKGITNVNFIGTENNEHLKEKVGEIKKVYYKI